MWLPKCTRAKMVDYCLYLGRNQEGAESLEAHQKLSARILTLSVNHTEFQRLRLRPMALSIETKGPAHGLDVAEVQMGIWHAAQWSSLRSAVFSSLESRVSAEEQGKETEDAMLRFPLISGVIIQGHKWLFVLSTREQFKTIFWTKRQFGTTQSIVDVYQVFAGLRQLAAWAENVHLPWSRLYVLTLAEDNAS
ncbi:hypothetical protein QQZ08_003701 [Neonectria magnoliae]|uniref:PD-(D/E)XK nuclease-like domain-containing protein n=1 Tax=Neonectria magnoliae TaxID=2732573 RepID=A0ABR1IAH8_9HYPO